jgi:hypothetical protein
MKLEVFCHKTFDDVRLWFLSAHPCHSRFPKAFRFSLSANEEKFSSARYWKRRRRANKKVNLSFFFSPTFSRVGLDREIEIETRAQGKFLGFFARLALS